MIRTQSILASDGVATAARFAGESGPALVFVHGVGSSAAIWDAQLRDLSESYRCFAVELRGNGVPVPEPDPVAIDRAGYARDVLAVASAFGIDRFVLVGCSLGGVVAFELWQHHSARIEAMALVGSFARYPNAQTYADGIVDAVEAAGSMPAFANQRAAKLGLAPERLRETLEQMARKSVPSYIAATRATWTGDYRSILASIDVPVWVACGEHDTVAPLTLTNEIARSIPGSMQTVIVGAGHVANADAPERFNQDLRRFLAQSRVS